MVLMGLIKPCRYDVVNMDFTAVVYYSTHRLIELNKAFNPGIAESSLLQITL